MTDDEVYNDVYGISYINAVKQNGLLEQSISQQVGKGFASVDELEEWAGQNLLDKLCYSPMKHNYLCVSHKGELILPPVFMEYYGNILYYVEQQGKRSTYIKWAPQGFKYYSNSYIPAEKSDGIHKPLYYRNYAVPTGFYSAIKDGFNVAKPFPAFAKETGRDTSFIYKYIEHVAGECSMWLLAWLRAKLLYPLTKTQVVPIIVSRAQGSGKTTFAEIICKGLFGADNVLVTDQYDSQSRFNADYADALIVCQEEKEEQDKRNPAAAIKSRATATTIRKEQKGIDPIYQESYTDFIMTTNKDVPIKFEGREDQRRFMIMNADEHFTRKESELADEIFTKLYGYDADNNKQGLPFNEDKDLIAQFKHELFSRQDIAAVKLRQFPKTAAYNRCFSLPRTTEASEIESILRALAPFIKESLQQCKVIDMIGDNRLTDTIQYVGALQFIPAFKEHSKFVALCRPLVFYDLSTNKPYQHSVVERTIYDSGPWLLSDYGIAIIPDMEPLLGGFTTVAGRYRTAPAAKFCLVEDLPKNPIGHVETFVADVLKQDERIGDKLYVNNKFVPDANGCFETVNEMLPGTKSLTNKSKNVQYMDTFLLESDSVSKLTAQLEEQRAKEYQDSHGPESIMRTQDLYKERLQLQQIESMRLFNDGIVCRIVYSGAKSYHLLVRVKDAPKTLEEYKWLHAYLCTTISNKLIFDEADSDPARLTRRPINWPRTSVAYGILVEGEQKLIAENYAHVYDLHWQELYAAWKARPMAAYEKFNRHLIPTRKEYREAMEALINKTFWTDPVWNGTRQEAFFPAYRLLRLLGYTHDMLWKDILPNGIHTYIKQNEQGYWLTRENSAIISAIDTSVDEYEKNMEDVQ